MATACVHMIVYSGVHAWPSAGYIRTYVLNLQALQQLGTWHIDLCLRFIDRLHAVVESAELCDEHAVILHVSTATTLRHIAYMPYRVGVYGAQSCIRPLAARSRRSVRALINATQTWHKLATHARKWLGRASPERPLHATRRRPLSSRSKLDRSTDLRAAVVISIPAPIRPCNDRTAAPHRQRAQIQVALRAGFIRQLYNLDVHASRASFTSSAVCACYAGSGTGGDAS